MYAFHYSRPNSLRGVNAALARSGEAKLLAGGQTLLPTMKQRLASPEAIVDLGAIADLAGIEKKGRMLVIGAMTRHADVAASPIIREAMPGLAAMAGGIGDPHVRNRGTIGGSIANNDPSADYPAALLALGASVVTNKRRIAAADFFQGLFSTALEEGEVITRVIFPIVPKFAYAKFRNPASRYAMVGVAVAKKEDAVRVAVTGAGADGVFRWEAAETVLSKRFSPEALEGLATPSPRDLNGDIHASSEYRSHLIGVMTRRAVASVSGQ